MGRTPDPSEGSRVRQEPQCPMPSGAHMGLGAMEAMMGMTFIGPLGSRAFSPIPGPTGMQGWYKGERCGPWDPVPKAEPTLSTGPWLTLQ